ncbi:MAG: hypothetical protein HYR75_09330 [Gemmatimonadetes bacterium]|nr:hypothetical protein [Gemmatimonadota bacterium]MBI3568361.1 hypothetical protein [Gemmatimonadota bacterium]
MMFRRVVAPLLAATAALIGACTNTNTGPTTVAALEFDTLPYPSIVTGDTMRDSTGKVAALHAVVLNGNGVIIPNASVQYIAFDTGVTVGAGGILTAQARSGSVRLIASSGGIQSKPLTVLVTRRPDSVVVTGKLVDTLFYDYKGSLTFDSPTLGVKLVTNDTAGGVTVTAGWLVSYQLLYNGTPVPLSDTTTAASLIDKATANLSHIDTTASDGTAGRRVRLRLARYTDTTGTAKLTVIATVRQKGLAVRGSPVTFVLYPRLHP